MSEENMTIRPKESSQPSVAPVQQPTSTMPLNPTAEDLPDNAEPAMEGKTVADDDEVSESEQIAGSEQLANDLAPETPKKETGIDEVLEQLRVQSKDSNIDSAAEDSDIDLETNQIIVGAKRGPELVEMLLTHYSDPSKYKAALNDPNSLLRKVQAAIDHGWGTTSGGDIAEVLLKGDTYKHLKEQSELDSNIKDGRPNRITHKNVELAGDDAILAIKARLGGIVRVNLLNSGFWVGLRSPEISELQEIFATIDFENREIGRILGGHFALITDMYLKQKFVDLLIKKRIVIQSNFGEIYKQGRLARNLAYHDYDTLLHAVVMLMTRGGLRYNCICPKCGKTSVETLDVGACKFVNETLWTDEVRKWWANTTDENGKLLIHNEQSLLKYRTEVLTYKRTFVIDVPCGYGNSMKVEFDFVEPTMQTYFDIGSALITSLTETINNISDGSQDKASLVQPTLALHHYQQIAPWISSIRMFKDDGVTIDMATSDPKAIRSLLDELSQHDKELSKALIEFIRTSRFNWIGTHSIKCSNPKCGARPVSSMENFYPLEIQTIFFGLLSRLWQSGR